MEIVCLVKEAPVEAIQKIFQRHVHTFSYYMSDKKQKQIRDKNNKRHLQNTYKKLNIVPLNVRTPDSKEVQKEPPDLFQEDVRWKTLHTFIMLYTVGAFLKDQNITPLRAHVASNSTCNAFPI